MASKKPTRVVLLPADSPNRTRTPKQIAAAVAAVKSGQKTVAKENERSRRLMTPTKKR